MTATTLIEKLAAQAERELARLADTKPTTPTVTVDEWKTKHRDYKTGDAGYGTARMLQYVEGKGTCLVPVEIDGVENLTAGMRRADDETEARQVATAMLRQIGVGNWMAISGRRVEIRETGITLPVSSGYAVAVDLAGNDTYTVRRVRKVNGITRSKGERSNVHAEEVGEVAYQASCYKNVAF